MNLNLVKDKDSTGCIELKWYWSNGDEHYKIKNSCEMNSSISDG
jgi:hypothetical protein